MLSKYTNVLSIAFKHEDFSDEDTEEFQDVVDDWCYHYVELLGIEGVSNYAHLLGAGHLYPYLKKWGNVYRFQQQGWEKKMALQQTHTKRWRWRLIWSCTHITNSTSDGMVSTFQGMDFWGC